MVERILVCCCLCLLSQILRLAHGAAWGPSSDPRFAALFARARVAIAWHAGVDHADNEEEHNSVLGPATLERLMRALQTGALPLCARRLLAALLGLPSTTVLGAGVASTTATGASTTAAVATAAEFESAQRRATEAVTAPRSGGEEEVALRSGWLHHDQRRQLLLFMKDWGLSVGPAAKLFRVAHQRASAVGSDAALGATTAAGHVMVKQRNRLQLS